MSSFFLTINYPAIAHIYLCFSVVTFKTKFPQTKNTNIYLLLLVCNKYITQPAHYLFPLLVWAEIRKLQNIFVLSFFPKPPNVSFSSTPKITAHKFLFFLLSTNCTFLLLLCLFWLRGTTQLHCFQCGGGKHKNPETYLFCVCLSPKTTQKATNNLSFFFVCPPKHT